MFYENVQELCKQHKTNITRMTKDIGLSNAAAASWKKGSVPKLDTVRKIADYFGVSWESLLDQSATVTASNGSIVINGNNNTSTAEASRSTGQLTEMEAEMLRIFRMMDMRRKSSAMSHFYEIEDELKGG